MVKRLLGVVMSGVMIISFSAETNVLASNSMQNFNENNIKIENVKKKSDLENLDSFVETVVMEEKNLKKFERDDVEEILDDGVSIIEIKNDTSKIDEFFGENISGDERQKGVIGYKIEKNGEDIIFEPIAVEAIDESGNIIERGEEYEKLFNNVTLDAEEYKVLVDENRDGNFVNQLPDEKIATLQASNSIGSAYTETSRTTYFYGKQGLSSKTKALKKGKSAGSGWNKMGFSTITLSAFNVGGKGAKRYDLFMGNIQVGSLNGYKLTDFTGQMRLYNQNRCSIIDCSTLKGAEENVSVSIGAGLGTSESGISKSLSAGYSYSYNPNGIKIKNVSGDSELQPNWKCYKKWYHCEKNERYSIKPSIVVKSPNGKTKETKVSMRVKKLYFEGTYLAYDVGNNSGSEYVHLEVCNHKRK